MASAGARAGRNGPAPPRRCHGASKGSQLVSRRRASAHAAPFLKRYVEDHDHDDQVLDIVVDALRSARTKVAPPALSSAAAGVTPFDAAPLASAPAAHHGAARLDREAGGARSVVLP